MAESLYPNDSEEMIWEYRVPEVLDRLYETMDQGDRTVTFILAFIFNWYFKLNSEYLFLFYLIDYIFFSFVTNYSQLKI